jgi:dihydroorotase-like cyclic amidohydrolase
MWRLLREGVLTHISSDHAPSTLAQKNEGSLWDVHFGLPGIDTTMSALIDAAGRGYLSREDISRVYAEVPARLYGLWPTKGSLQVGFDADMALVDPAARWRIGNEDVISKAGWSPYSGREMHGRVVQTILRGQTIAADGQVDDERRGQWMAGAAGLRGA